VTDALTRATRIVYDALDRATKIIDARNSDPDPACGTLGVTCLAYDGAGNPIAVTDGNGNQTDFA
jgi:hypothetical protein